MPIDRKRFLTLAMSLALGGAVGCGPKAAAPANPDKDHDGETTTGPTDEGGGGPTEEGASMTPAQECIAWDVSGECTEFDESEGMYPAEECVDWDANGECIQFEQANYPDD